MKRDDWLEGKWDDETVFETKEDLINNIIDTLQPNSLHIDKPFLARETATVSKESAA